MRRCEMTSTGTTSSCEHMDATPPATKLVTDARDVASVLSGSDLFRSDLTRSSVPRYSMRVGMADRNTSPKPLPMARLSHPVVSHACAVRAIAVVGRQLVGEERWEWEMYWM